MIEIALFSAARKNFYTALLKSGVLRMIARNSPKKSLPNKFPSNADGDSATSIAIAQGIFDQIQSKARVGSPLATQISGGKFVHITRSFIETTFSTLKTFRPDKWDLRTEQRASLRFEQYQRLAELSQVAERNLEIADLLSNDYVIAPDVLVVREPEPDETINRKRVLVDKTVASDSRIRERNNKLPNLHASISCKWKLRSDNAQNARSEALTLIRNREGRVPNIAVVTGEPLPSRLALLALGTRDIDCVYHFALPELINSVAKLRIEDSIHLIKIMVDGKRLKDITDLPLDLAT